MLSHQAFKSKGLRFKAVTITGGDHANYSGGSYRVPKRDLVAALEVSLQTNTLKVAEGLELWPALREEMLNFRRKINLKTPHDSYEHWRESDHDDLVLATALACWWTRKENAHEKGGPSFKGPPLKRSSAYLPNGGVN